MNQKQNKRILVFNVNWLGDVLFSTAAIRNIRHNFPDSFIACAIPSRCYQVLKGNPHLDEIMIFDEKDRHKGLLGKLNFVKQLKAKSFDTVFLLHRSFRRALLCRLAGIENRYGYYTKKRGFLLTKKILPPKKDSVHRIDYYLNVIEQAGLKVEDRYLEFFFDDKDAKEVENFLDKRGVKKEDLLVAVNPGGNWMLKRWPKEYWAFLSDALVKELNAKVLITGSLADATLTKEIEGLMREKPIVTSSVFNLKQLGALCKRVDLFITADTGPLHIANAVGAKNIIALFGPTSVEVTGPHPPKNVVIFQKDIGCKIPCYKLKCEDNRCMKAITPQEVLEKIKELQQGKNIKSKI